MLLTHEELFVATIQDLRNKISIGKEYELIRACGLCRHLLIDSHPLVHIVNKKYKIIIKFLVADLSNHPASYVRAHYGWKTIEPLEILPSKSINLSEFLSIILLNYHNIDFNVGEIISAASHYYGGIHSGKPEKNNRI